VYGVCVCVGVCMCGVCVVRVCARARACVCEMCGVCVRGSLHIVRCYTVSPPSRGNDVPDLNCEIFWPWIQYSRFRSPVYCLLGCGAGHSVSHLPTFRKDTPLSFTLPETCELSLSTAR